MLHSPRMGGAWQAQVETATTWMWDALTGDLLTILPGGGRDIRHRDTDQFVFAPDGTRIASFGLPERTKVWSVGPRFTSESVVNAASFVSGPIAPGEIISIFGAGLGPETPTRGVVDPETGRLPTALESVSVLLDGEPSPLLYVRETQINAQVPYEIAGRSSVQLAVSYGSIDSPRATLAVSPARPALFLIPGSRSAIVLNEDGRLNSASQPARLGRVGHAVRHRAGRDVAAQWHRSDGSGNERTSDRRGVGHGGGQCRGGRLCRLGSRVCRGLSDPGSDPGHRHNRRGDSRLGHHPGRVQSDRCGDVHRLAVTRCDEEIRLPRRA